MKKTIVSLTILPSRIKLLQQTLKSLRDQDCDDYTVRVYIPENPLRDKPLKEIPKFLLDTSWFDDNSNGILTYTFTEDIGSITKLIPALLEYPDDNIVTCDDDVIYPKRWLSGLVNKFDGTEVLAYRGRIFLNTQKDYKKSKVLPTNKIKKDINVNIVTGTWGAIYTKKMFPQEFFDKYNKNTFWSRIDDIWITGHLWKNKIPIKIIKSDIIIKPTDASKINSLWEGNMNGVRNNKGIKYFNEK